MNFLAHFHLARHDDDLIVGALLGDFIKGPMRGDFTPGIEKGIMLHRRIDMVTDQFVIDQRLHQCFDPQFRRYLGIMLDLYFDHLLARNWSAYHGTDLAGFSHIVLTALSTHLHAMPDNAALLFNRLQAHKLLERYQQADIIEQILARISQRLSKANPLTEAMPAMQEQDEYLAGIFTDLYQRLEKEVAGALSAWA